MARKSKSMPLKLQALQFLAFMALFWFVFRPAFLGSPWWMQGIIQTVIWYKILQVLFPALWQGYNMGKTVAFLKMKKEVKSGERRYADAGKHAESPEADAKDVPKKTD